MNTALELFQHCASTGIELWVEDGKIRYRGATAVVDSVLPEIARLKPQLLELLSTDVHQKPETPAASLAWWREDGHILWLGTVTQDGIDHETLCYDAPFATPPNRATHAAVLEADAPLLAVALKAETLASAEASPMPQAERLAIVAILERERRGGSYLVATPALLACWRRLNHLTGLKLSSRHLGVFVHLATAHPDLDSAELLDLFTPGLQPDEGKPLAESPLWREPLELAEEAEGVGRQRARAHLEAIRAQRGVAA